MSTTRENPRVVLASSSPRRRELLSGLGVTFDVCPSAADEVVEDRVSPDRYVMILAERKARDVASGIRSRDRSIVIGADTVVVKDGQILGKPVDVEDAKRKLRQLQGQTHTVYTGLSVFDVPSGHFKTTCSSTQVTMRAMSDSLIDRYVGTGEPLDKAGAYAIQGFGSTLVTHISGDYFTVVGLPLYVLSDVLAEFGLPVL